VSGAPIDIDLYETLLNASAGGSTGRLAQSYAGVNTWLLNDANYNAWDEGDENSKALRFFAADTLSTNNRSNLRYQAFPTPLRACGAVQDVFGLSAAIVFSLRQLIGANNEGDLITIRETQTSAEPNQKFGATLGNEVDFAAIATYGGATAGIEKIFDASGNNNPTFKNLSTTGTLVPLLQTANKRIYVSQGITLYAEDIVFDEGAEITFVCFGNFDGTNANSIGIDNAVVSLIWQEGILSTQAYQIRFGMRASGTSKSLFMSNRIGGGGVAGGVTNVRTHNYTGSNEGLVVVRIRENGDYNLQFFNGTSGNVFNNNILNRVTGGVVSGAITIPTDPLPKFRFITGLSSATQNRNSAQFYYNTAMFYKSYLTDGQVQQLKNLFNVT
jgi:hypothetical protein